ncbi:MAG: hypothetical protein ACE5G8_16155, partial [Anaerolineae bacterium]
MQNLSPAWRNFVQNLFGYVVALAIVIGVFTFFKSPWLLVLMWLVAVGGIIALAIQASRLASGAEKERVNAEARLQTQLDQTLAYKKQIDHVIRGLLRKRAAPGGLERLREQVQHWTESIESLIVRVSELRQNALIQQDMQRVPKAIADLEARLAAEPDEAIKAQLERTLNNRRKQLTALETLQKTMRRSEIQIESTISMLGTIYSQLLTSQSTSHVADYSR